MGTTDHTMDAIAFSDAPKRRSYAGFVILALLGLCGAVFVLAYRQAPYLSADPYNWVLWARGDKMWAGLTALALVFTAIGIIGWLGRVLSAAPKAALRPVPAQPAVTHRAPGYAVADDALSIPAIRAADDEPAPRPFAEPAATGIGAEIRSLEPAVFHDNASDSFLTRMPEAPAAVTVQPTAEIIPLRPVIAPVLQVPADPVEAALLADSSPAAPAPAPAPQSDMNAVIASAMHFADAPAVQAPETAAPVTTTLEVPVPAPVEAAIAEPTTVASAPLIVTEPEPAVADAQSEIRQAVQTALSVWPDNTRAIAAEELGARISRLYYDPAPESARAFHLIATGDLKAAATAVQAHAESLAQQGRNAEAAEQWRILGAIHMGRDDPRALAAYEKVSELDPSDSNIHLYLARRYQMAGDTTKMLPVLGRALGVISDPQTRAELLTPYADLKMKAGETRAAGDAFEELSRLHETSAYLKPDDVAAKSAYAVTLARLAQAREMHGAFDVAGPLYRKAHSVFAELSAKKPDHPGLRAMADNALRDAQRFS